MTKIIRKLFTPFETVPRRNEVGAFLILLAGALAVWQGASGGLVPGPVDVLVRMLTTVTSEQFLIDAVASAWLSAKAMAISIAVSTVIAYASVIPAFRLASHAITRFRYLTVSSLTFVFVLLSGDSDSLKVNLLLFAIVPFFVTSLLGVVADAKNDEYDLCRTLGMGPWRTFLETLVIGRMDQLLLVVQVNWAISWMMITSIEGQAMSGGGLGTILIKQGKYMELTAVFSVLALILVMGMVSDVLIGMMRSWLFPHTRKRS